MTLIGNTPAEVKAFLYAQQTPPRKDRDTRAMTRADQAVLMTRCPRCDAIGELCLSETGLPLSGPHRERVLSAR